MSHPASQAHPISSEAAENGDDGVNLKLIVMVGVVSLVVFLASAVIAWWILREDTKKYEAKGVAPPVTGLGRIEEVGIIDSVPFDADHRLERWQQQKAKQLNGYGWADKQKGYIHIPIEEAMKEVIRDATGPAASPPATPPAAAPAGGGTP